MADKDQNQIGTEKRADIAGRDTPLIRQDWYVACLSHEVTRRPMQRTILEQDVVLYRREDGTAVALQNRCAHRSYPLHLGALNGDRIVCGYHGFEYGPDGRCAHVPSLGAERPGIRVQSYPVKELGPFIWIWTGDPDAVNYDKFIEQPWFADPAWRHQSGYIYIKANYLGLKENVNDLTHFPFLHTFAKDQLHLARQPIEVETQPDLVCMSHRMPDFPAPPAIRNVMQFEGSVTEHARSISRTPAMEYARVTHTDSSNPPKVAARYIIHCTTPETPTTTHYHWAIARDFGLDSQEVDEETLAIASAAFHEDAVALEEIERLIARDKRPGFREMIVASDAAGIQAMRLLARKAKEEAQD